MVLGEQSTHDMSPDKTGSACNQDFQNSATSQSGDKVACALTMITPRGRKQSSPDSRAPDCVAAIWSRCKAVKNHRAPLPYPCEDTAWISRFRIDDLISFYRVPAQGRNRLCGEVHSRAVTSLGGPEMAGLSCPARMSPGISVSSDMLTVSSGSLRYRRIPARGRLSRWPEVADNSRKYLEAVRPYCRQERFGECGARRCVGGGGTGAATFPYA